MVIQMTSSSSPNCRAASPKQVAERTLASMQEGISMQPPEFSDDFRRQFRELLAWRRDVRRFRRQPIDPAILGELLSFARLAPSVGNSQPWRFVLVEEPERRAEIRDVFARCNEAARATYSDACAALLGESSSYSYLTPGEKGPA
jgi:hypothetical protein